MADFTVSTEIDDFMRSADKAAMRTNMDLGTSAVKDVPATGDASAGEVVLGNDTRLTDARTPTSHTHTASEVTDFDTEVSNNVDVAANTSKLAGIEAGAEVNNISDVNATDLTDGGDSTLHYHSADRARANHTGTQTLSTISDAGTIASQDANSVTITGGSVTGITDLAIADGGTGAGTAAGARTNLEVYSTSEVDEYLGPKATAGGVRLDGSQTSTDLNVGEDISRLIGTATTFSFWINTSLSDFQAILGSNTFTSSGFEIQTWPDGKLRIEFRPSGGAARIRFGDAINDDKWHFCVFVIDWTSNDSSSFPDIDVYIDSQLASETIESAYSGTYSTTATFIEAFARGSSIPVDGSVRDLAIFNRALTAAEVETLYRNGLAGIADADRWGGLNLEADWSSTTDGWINYVGGATTSRVASYTDGASVTKNNVLLSSGGETNNLSNNIANQRTAGKSYRVTGWVQSDVAGKLWLQNYFGFTAITVKETQVLADTWTKIDWLITSNTTGTWNLAFLQSSTAESEVRLSELKIEEIGCIAAYPMDEGIGYQLHDISSNHYDGLLSTSGFTHLVPKTEGYIREYGVDMYGSVVGLVDSSRSILPEDALITRASLINQNNATVSGSLYMYRMSGALTDQINNFSTSMAAVSGRYMNTFAQDGVEQDNTYKNVGVRSYDTDATNIDIRVDYEVL